VAERLKVGGAVPHTTLIPLATRRYSFGLLNFAAHSPEDVATLLKRPFCVPRTDRMFRTEGALDDHEILAGSARHHTGCTVQIGGSARGYQRDLRDVGRPAGTQVSSTHGPSGLHIYASRPCEEMRAHAAMRDVRSRVHVCDGGSQNNLTDRCPESALERARSAGGGRGCHRSVRPPGQRPCCYGALAAIMRRESLVCQVSGRGGDHRGARQNAFVRR
jgi:hypothetical protein